jgi:radical SAM superfamily enzyme YgiQ (UPF0313 family)
MRLLLATLHAKYIHASLALPCLAASCDGLPGVESIIREFTVNEPHDQVFRALVKEQADVVAFSCYIWNIDATLRLASDLKLLHPETFIILGGPEAAYDSAELLERNPCIDCVVQGEGEATFAAVIAELAKPRRGSSPAEALDTVAGITLRLGETIVATGERAPIADLDTIPSPFDTGRVDLDKQLVYYETSRGCPFSCAFCMSSLEKGVRSFSRERIERDLELLIRTGIRTVKLVDRTFNFDAARADAIWVFILDRHPSGTFHFEIAADLLTDANIALLSRVPAGMFRFEIGIQSGSDETLAAVGRRSDLSRLFANVRRLREETGVTVHLDLVAGLPGEDFPGFLRSLQALLDLAPHHIQVEPLKVLKGSPMRQIARSEGYLFSRTPPYKILRTPWLSFAEISRIETIGRLLDLVGNSGRFRTFLHALAASMEMARFYTDLAGFWETNAIPAHLSLADLFRTLWQFCSTTLSPEVREPCRDALRFDYCLVEYPAGRLPAFLGEASTGTLHRERIDAMVRDISPPQGSRVRTFLAGFPRDYRHPPFTDGRTDILFVYVSTPGAGLRVIPLLARETAHPSERS